MITKIIENGLLVLINKKRWVKEMSIKNFADLKEKAKKLKPIRISVAAAADEKVIESIKLAQDLNIIKNPILTGDKNKIEKIIAKNNIELKKYEIIDAINDAEAAKLAVQAVKEKKVKAIAKGKLETIYYLKAILDKEKGIKASKVLNNLTLFEMESYHKLIAISDNAIIMEPSLEDKKAIIENTKQLWSALEIETPKVAVLAAVEIVNSKMQATVDGCCLSKMVDRGQIKGFDIDGPLSYDIAMSLECAERKSMKDFKVPGDPDLLVMPNLEAANILGKSYKLHGNAKSGGIVFGADVPVILNSRSDKAKRRLNSIVMARVIAERMGY